MNLIAQLEAEQIAALGKTIPDFRPGDTIRVGYKDGEFMLNPTASELAIELEMDRDEVVEGAQRFVERRQRVPAVHVVDVDIVGAQPAKACLQRFADVPARQSDLVGVAPHRPARPPKRRGSGGLRGGPGRSRRRPGVCVERPQPTG